MQSNREFNDILNECLERMLGGEPIEQCLQAYPGQAAELEPLLQTAVAAHRISDLEPDPDFKARARYQFRSALSDSGARRSRAPGWLPQWAAVATIALVVVLAGGGTVLASGNSMPNNPLYQVKLATEQVRLFLTTEATAKAELCITYADRRVEEIVYMAEQGDAQQVERATQRLGERLALLTTLAPTTELASEAKLMTTQAAPEALAAPANTAPSGAAPPPAEGDAQTENAEDYAAADSHITFDATSEIGRSAVDAVSDAEARLRAALEQADEAMKPALEQAIAVLVTDYQTAIEVWR